MGAGPWMGGVVGRELRVWREVGSGAAMQVNAGREMGMEGEGLGVGVGVGVSVAACASAGACAPPTGERWRRCRVTSTSRGSGVT